MTRRPPPRMLATKPRPEQWPKAAPEREPTSNVAAQVKYDGQMVSEFNESGHCIGNWIMCERPTVITRGAHVVCRKWGGRLLARYLYLMRMRRRQNHPVRTAYLSFHWHVLRRRPGG